MSASGFGQMGLGIKAPSLNLDQPSCDLNLSTLGFLDLTLAGRLKLSWPAWRRRRGGAMAPGEDGCSGRYGPTLR